MKRKLWLTPLMAGTLLLMSTSALATQYLTRFKNCDLVNIAPKKWQAKFMMEVEVEPFATDTTNNTFYAWVPQINPATGKPTDHDPRKRALSAGFSFPAYPDGVKPDLFQDSNVHFISSSSNQNVIKKGGSYIIEFTTKDNNAYPALYMTSLNNAGMSVITYLMILPNSSSCYKGETPPNTTPPIEDLEPPEPEFKMKNAVWELNTIDVGDLPDVALPGNGYVATIKNVGSNHLCLSYVTKGVKNKDYSLGVTNSGGHFGGRNLLAMNGAEGSQLPYRLQLNSNDGNSANNYYFPSSDVKYITLTQDTSAERSEMCWTPAVNLFKTNTTQKGMHTDTVNFIITPKA